MTHQPNTPDSLAEGNERTSEAPAGRSAREVPDVDALANFIRYIDGTNKMGASTLAEWIVEWMRSSPAALSAPAQEPDLRDAFERIYPIPPDCMRCGNSYAATSFNAWRAHEFIERFEGYRAAFSSVPTQVAPAVVVPDRWKFDVTTSDGRVWLTVKTPHGASAALSTVQKDGNGSETIAAQVLLYLRDMLAAAPQPPAAAQEPVLCVSSKAFRRMRAGDDHIKAWLPPATDEEDMLLYTHPAPQQAGGNDIAVREALRQIIEADDRQALTQQLIDVGRAALEAEEAPKEPMSDPDVLAIEVLQYNFGLNGGAGPVSKKGWKIIRAIEAHHGIGSAGGINARAQEGKQRD